jgi:hypothetical protein
MRKFKAAAALAVAIVVTSCSTTPEALEKSSGKVGATRNFSENYQEIYRRIYEPATRCQSGNISPMASLNIDSQLYTELGYGEVTKSMINWGTRNYYWKAKIERAGTGSKLTVSAGNTLYNQVMLDDILRWASGDSKC